MRTSIALLLLLAACSSGTSGGANNPAPNPSADMPTGDVAAACEQQQDGQVFSGFFSGPADFARVLLCDGHRYKVETDAGGVRFEVKPLMPGVQAPQVIDMISGGGAMGMGTLKEVRAQASGVFEIRVALARQGAGTKLTVTRDGTWK